MRKLVIVCVPFLLLNGIFSQQNVQAQNSSCRGVLSNSTATMSSASYRLKGTLGQSVVGVTGNSSISHKVGFVRLLTAKKASGEILAEDLTHDDNASKTAEVATSAELPKVFRLEQNYPNPFNPETAIRYQLPKAGEVTLRIYNLLGEEVITLHQGNLEAGSYQFLWNGKNQYGQNVASGVYLYRLEVHAATGERFVATRKMNLLR